VRLYKWPASTCVQRGARGSLAPPCGWTATPPLLRQPVPQASERGRACTESGNAQIGDDAGAVQAYACFCDSNCAALLAALLAAAMCSLQAARLDAAARACAAARSARSSCSWTTRTRSCMSCSPGAAAAPAPRISHPGYAAHSLSSDTSNTPNTSSSMQKKPPSEELPRWP